MTEELKKEILNILDNVYYWETCPQEYNDRIDAVKKLIIPDVSTRFSTRSFIIGCGCGMTLGLMLAIIIINVC
jgi:cellobiose-specific phosphotransferase system component IIC